MRYEMERVGKRARKARSTGRRGRSGGRTSRQERHWPRSSPASQITTAGLVPAGLWRLRVSPGHSGPAARAQSCLTRAGHCPEVCLHEIPDSEISHRNTGSSPRSGTEAGDISPVFAALEHAAGDLTTLGTNPLHGGSSPPSRTHRVADRTAGVIPTELLR
jgi:hypothetical protein